MIEVGALLGAFVILVATGLVIWRSIAGRPSRRRNLLGRISIVALIALAIVSVSTYNLVNARTIQIFGEIVPRVETAAPVVALTFDDGPNLPYTNDLIKVLREKNVKATFFVIGGNLEKFPDTGRELVGHGHELGNHSFSHKRMVFKSSDFIQNEIERTDQLIRDVGYSGTIHFRSPYGKKFLLLPFYLSSTGRKNIFIDVEPDSYPEVAESSEKIVQHVVEHARPGSIIILHAETGSRSTSLQAVAGIIDELTRKGYKFVTVSELLGNN